MFWFQCRFNCSYADKIKCLHFTIDRMECIRFLYYPLFISQKSNVHFPHWPSNNINIIRLILAHIHSIILHSKRVNSTNCANALKQTREFGYWERFRRTIFGIYIANNYTPKSSVYRKLILAKPFRTNALKRNILQWPKCSCFSVRILLVHAFTPRWQTKRHACTKIVHICYSWAVLCSAICIICSILEFLIYDCFANRYVPFKVYTLFSLKLNSVWKALIKNEIRRQQFATMKIPNKRHVTTAFGIEKSKWKTGTKTHWENEELCWAAIRMVFFLCFIYKFLVSFRFRCSFSSFRDEFVFLYAHCIALHWKAYENRCAKNEANREQRVTQMPDFTFIFILQVISSLSMAF